MNRYEKLIGELEDIGKLEDRVKELEAALMRIYDNCSDVDLVIDVSIEALEGALTNEQV